MPKNCAIVGCTVDSNRCKGLSFFSIRRPNNPEWENALVRVINRADDSFNVKNATICSRHFKEECFVRRGHDGVSLKIGSIPTEYIPQKSIETSSVPCRKPPAERQPVQPPLKVVKYYNFGEVRKAAEALPAPWCLISNTEEKLVAAVIEEDSLKLKVTILPDFSTTVRAMGLAASGMNSSVESITLKHYLTNLSKLCLCLGIVDSDLQKFADMPNINQQQVYFRHILYAGTSESSITHTSTVRSMSCTLLTPSANTVCRPCTETRRLLEKKRDRLSSKISGQLHACTPLSSVPTEKLKAELKTIRKDKKSLEKKISDFKKSITEESLSVPPSMHDSLKHAVELHYSNITDTLQKLFWQEQMKAFSAGTKGMRWHPAMIRLAILLHSKSPAAYETLRATGVLQLPGESTLRDYTNVYQPKAGFQRSVLDEIIKSTKDYKDEQRFVVLLHDEMAIKSDLVFEKRSGQLVGFITSEHETETPSLATHALVFYVVGVNTSLNTSLAFFGTQTCRSDTLFSLLWKAIGILETVCHLKVIASTSDKSSANQRLYDMHNCGSKSDICYKTVNRFAMDREIFFISDVPHLIKTVRNNLFNSGSGKNSRYLWLNDQHLLWKHVVDVYNRDVEGELKRTKLTYDHVHLTAHSTMNVKLAAQVLSFRVGKVMQEYGGPDCQETARFLLLMDRFFDCLNTRSCSEGLQKRKSDLMPYRTINDERFQFLQELLEYLQKWKTAVENRPGKFSKTERSKMLISLQTFKGLSITLKSFPEMARYLLSNGVEYILSNKFCQDPIEKHFGRQRSLGRRCENPSLWMFGYNENKLRLQRQLALKFEPKGNIKKPKRSTDSDPVQVSASPMKKIMRR